MNFLADAPRLLHRIANEAALAAALNDLSDVIIFRKPIRRPVNTGTNKGSKARSTAQPDLYKKDKVWQISSDVDANFAKLYAYCFTLAKPE